MFEQAPEFQTPHQVIPLWTDTILHQPGNRGRRGCGGRFIFYAGERKEGVRVDGAVTVYVWNDSRSTKQRKPERKYVFTADNLQNHYSNSKVGHSYSFWIPWDEAGSERTELTVVVRFVGRDGTDITAPASKVILPGPVAMPMAQRTQYQDTEDRQDARGDGIQQTSWTRQQDNRSRVRQSLRSSEIHVSPGFVKRNQQVATNSLSVSDLFSQSDDLQSPGISIGQREDDLTSSERSDVAAGRDQTVEIDFSAKRSAQRSAHLLRSRFQARKERAVQRVASAPETEPFLATSPQSR
ncbi:MAG: hypothetical protein MK102_11860 [Fuerstiella sp.]|nr:hypothetical protein [Fuerstiella sp.]